jgi:hypothetical protein
MTSSCAPSVFTSCEAALSQDAEQRDEIAPSPPKM